MLGRTAWGTVRDIHLPVLRPSILTTLLIVFVDDASHILKVRIQAFIRVMVA